MTQPPRDDSEPPESAGQPGGWQPPGEEDERPGRDDPYAGSADEPPPGGHPPYPQQQAGGQHPPGSPYEQQPPYGPPPGGPYQSQGPYQGQPQGPYGQYPPYGQEPGGTSAPAPPLGGSGARFVARLVDTLIVFLVSLLLGAPLIADYIGDVRSSFGQGQTGQTTFDGQLSLTGISTGVYFLYDWLLHAFWNGQTLGKRIMSIRVANLDTGQPPSAGQQAGRSAIFALPAIVPCCGNIFWLVNVLWHLWDKPFQQCLHDKPTRTVVVATR